MKNKKAFSLIEISVVILVIGILIAGISKGMDLYQDFKLSTARSLTMNSIVGRIDGLSLWLETSTQSSLKNNNSTTISDDDNIKNWIDINPIKNDTIIASQTITSEQPKYKKNGIGGIPSLFFDANTSGSSGKSLSINFNSSINTSTFTIFLVTLPIQTSSDWGAIINSRYSFQTGYAILKNDSNQTISFRISTGTTPSVSAYDMPFKNNKAYVLTLIRESSKNLIYENSVLKSQLDSTFARNINSPFSIGYQPSLGRYYDGLISEIIYFNRNLDKKERLEVEKYLLLKYQIK